MDKKTPNSSQLPYLDRDISWLSFNYRVLQEAKDPTVPLMERVKFLAIYSSNLGEFFRVRVANHRNLIRLGKKTKKELQYEPEEVLAKIISIVTIQMREFSRIFDDEIVPGLKKNKINILRRKELNTEQLEFVATYFMDNMLPYCQPVLLYEDTVKPFLNDAELYLVLDMKRKGDSPSHHYAMVKIPSDHLPRFINLPAHKNQHDIIMLDDIVRQNASILFPGFELVDSYSIKLTRDAELYIDDEYSGDLLQKIKKSLNKRNVGPASRLVFDVNMPKRLLKHLSGVLDLEGSDLIPEGKYHNNFDFFQLPDFGKSHLTNKKLTPLKSNLEGAKDIFRAMIEKDYFLHVPFQSYEALIQFFEKAAVDQEVTHIKIVQYRVAKDSRIMSALTKAAKNGKKIFVFIEIKARFDEEANLKWGEKLEKAGIKIRYSFPGLKVHSKIALIRKVSKGKARQYCYLSTGNFHEGTAKVYTDMGLFTTNRKITVEVARLFHFLETVKLPKRNFQHLLVGQFNMYDTIIKMINKEISNAEEGKKASIHLKLNSLEDTTIIDLLEKAREVGVELRLIVRGIFCMKVDKSLFNEKFRAISIVDRFLEHSRIYMFHNGGKQKIYLSSADWMVRNLHKRIETAFPIYDKDIAAEIRHIFDLQWNDNVKARLLDSDLKNEYVQTSNKKKVQSQLETYNYYKKKMKKDA